MLCDDAEQWMLPEVLSDVELLSMTEASAEQWMLSGGPVASTEEAIEELMRERKGRNGEEL